MNIFVSIASYRDNSCATTINDLYEKASNPHKIFVGICQQNSNEDNDCVLDLKHHLYEKIRNNIRIIRIPFYDAKGPVYARYLCSSLLDKTNEDYYLQIDSHSIFIKDWDIILISMIQEIIKKNLSKKPVISYYPKDIINKDKEDKENNYYVPVINDVIFENNKKIFILGQAIYTNTNNSFIRTPFVTGGFFFCFSSFIDELPFDPTLDYLFSGEEILNSIKFYTNGYDVFVPKFNIIYHEYIRNEKPKYWNESRIAFDDRKALAKIRFYLFNYNENLKDPYYYNYKLGTKRTIDDFYKFANIDIKKYNYNNYKKNNKKTIIIFVIITIIIIILIIIPKLLNLV